MVRAVGDSAEHPPADPLGDRAEPERPYEPLPEGWSEQAEALAELFIAPRGLVDAERLSLAAFAGTCLKYAYMERRIQGEIICEIPAHLSVLRRDRHPSLREEAEELAAAERENLRIPEGPVEDLAELLDDQGVKVIEWPHPTGSLAGAFMFQEDTGPALLTLAPPGAAAGRLILAHAYCHLLADVDPYSSRFCPCGGDLERSPLARGGRLLEESDLAEEDEETGVPETRADLFARAFLLPRDHFVQTVTNFGQGGRAGFQAERLADVAYYYSVDPQVVLARLIDLEILSIAAAREMAAQVPDKDAGTQASGRSHDLLAQYPRRFVNLALALFLKHEISRRQLASILSVDQATVAQFLAWADHRAGPREKAGRSVADDAAPEDPAGGTSAPSGSG